MRLASSGWHAPCLVWLAYFSAVVELDGYGTCASELCSAVRAFTALAFRWSGADSFVCSWSISQLARVALRPPECNCLRRRFSSKKAYHCLRQRVKPVVDAHSCDPKGLLANKHTARSAHFAAWTRFELSETDIGSPSLYCMSSTRGGGPEERNEGLSCRKRPRSSLNNSS